MTKITLEELYVRLEGKTDRAEIEEILNGASVAVLKKYVKQEGIYSVGCGTWKKADFVETIAVSIMNDIASEAPRTEPPDAIKRFEVGKSYQHVIPNYRTMIYTVLSREGDSVVLGIHLYDEMEKFFAEQGIQVDGEIYDTIKKKVNGIVCGGELIFFDIANGTLYAVDEIDDTSDTETESKKTQEGNTMIQTAALQAITAVKEATTVKAIRDALMTCTVKDMLKVCAEVTGVEYAVKASGVKAEKARIIANFIMRHREEEAFKALTVSQKYEAMTTAQPNEMHSLVNWCSVEELREIAQRLNIPLDVEYADDLEYCAGVVYYGFRALRFERTIKERIAEGADKEAVKNELKNCPRSLHEALMLRAGIELDGALPRDVIIERIASHFMKSNQPNQPEPEINPEDTNIAEYGILQANINVSISVRSALKTAMNALDPKSKDYAVLDELYYCEGQDIEGYIERRRVIHKAITTLRGVRLTERNLAYMA